MSDLLLGLGVEEPGHTVQVPLLGLGVEEPGHTVQVPVLPVQVEADVLLGLADRSLAANLRVLTEELGYLKEEGGGIGRRKRGREERE